MSTPQDAQERAQLCDLFDELGPDAPTLCEGWDTVDLAAHLVIRERNPLDSPGILFPDALGGRFGRRVDRAMEAAKARGFAALVDAIRTGPPLLTPFSIPGVRELVNLNEYFVHHEDVRRANGRGPRNDVPDLDDALWRYLSRAARFAVRRVHGAGVTLVRPDGSQIRATKTSPTVRISGGPGELALYLTGRKGAAEVELSGPDDAVAAVAAAPMGV